MIVKNILILYSKLGLLFLQMKSISIFRGIMLAMYAILKIAQAFLYSWSGSALTYEVNRITKFICYYFSSRMIKQN